MKKHCSTTLFLCLILFTSFAQDLPVRYFEITQPKIKKALIPYTKVPNSLYSKVTLLDMRDDTSQIGKINTGLMRREAVLKMRTPFQPQLQLLVDSLIDGTASAGELVFQLRNFYFIEDWSTRYCYLQAALYAKQPAGYGRISILDTVLVLTTNDVYGTVTTAASHVLTDFLSDGLPRKSGDTLFSMQEVLGYDSIEKSHIPLYTTSQYKDGIYYDYYSFSRQEPDQQGNIETNRKGEITRIELQDSTGKKVKLKSKNCYAVVVKGKAFIATEYGYYPLQKSFNNLYFTGDVRIAASESDKNGGQLALGLLGRAMASSGTQTTYEMSIDHVSGVFLHLRKIVKDPQTQL